MHAFLEKVVEQILLKPIEELGECLIIVPNRRAKLYINKYISQKIEKPIWSAEIISINDFVYKQLDLQQPSSLELLMQLYKVHKSIEYRNPQDIDQFSSWGELLINDFNDIDLYLAPIDKLFKYLSDVKKIASWELDPDRLTPQEKKYLKFYEGLSKYYYLLHENLLAENLAYQGMAFRLLSNKISEIDFAYKRIYIAGFNALSPTEKNIFDFLKKNYQTQFFWDIDAYYFDNKEHEAGRFLRKELYNEERKKISFISNYWTSLSKNINIYGVNGNIAQVKYAAQIIDNNIQNNSYKLEETAIILANEELMIPMLNSIPNSVERFNLTMSYPLKYHAIYELVDIIIDIYSGEINKDNDFVLKIYYKDFFRFIKHSFIQGVLDAKTLNDIKNVEKRINRSNVARITLQDKYILELSASNDILAGIIKIFGGFNKDVTSIVDVIIIFLQYIDTVIVDDLDKTFVQHFVNVISDLQILISSIDKIQKAGTIKKWVNKVLNQSPLPFSGEPLEGMQIMGMLESRTLDYKNIIFISLNEGVLPKEKAYQSFILYEVKHEFGLPLPRENDAITSYHFYRLLQRAENISLLYNSNADAMQSGESSRFVKQLEIELPTYNKQIKTNHYFVSIDANSKDNATSIEIEKTDVILKQLKEYVVEKGLSPSSLNTYKKCSYLFYLQKIVHLKKDDEVEEQMAYNTQGNIVHETLEEIYKDYIGKQISFIDFKSKANKVMETFNAKLNQLFGSKNTETGKNYLTRVILERFVSNFVEVESKYLKENGAIEIIGVEENLEKTLAVDIDNELINVKYRGSADRIDKLKSQVRIVDYKTGSVVDSHLRIGINKNKDQWDKMFTDEYDKAFQLMMYAWMYWDNKAAFNSISSGILALKKHSIYYPLKLYGEDVITEEHILRFEEDLKQLTAEIFDKRVTFSQRKADRICTNCDYKTICMRK